MKTKKIQLRDLKVGDKIKTLDPKTYENTFKTVTSIWDTEVPKEDQVTLTFMGGTQLHCSINHPIMTLTEDGVKQTLPNELNESDWVISENAFTKLDARTGDDQPTGYIDITVEGTHTFFAASSPDEEMVLTHNSQGGIRNACIRKDTPVRITREIIRGFIVKSQVITVPVSEVEIGDFIESFDTETGENKWCEVLNTFTHPTKAADLIKVIYLGRELIISENHPIWNPAKGQWINGRDLTTEDVLLAVDGKTHVTIDSITRNLGVDEELIDLHVEGTNTYYAGGVLQHNSATITFPIWHYQFDDMIVLKNNQGTEETRVRHLDYSIAMSAFFWRRFKKQENITFFDPNEVPDMYEAFYRDTEEFERLYLMYEKKSGLRTKTLPAAKVIQNMLIRERSQVGRIYITNVDNVIRHTPFDTKKNPIYMSNLCQEIFIPSQPFESVDDAGELVFSYHGEDLHVPNTAKAQLADGTVKDVRYVDEEDDVLAFRLPSGITITLEGDVE